MKKVRYLLLGLIICATTSVFSMEKEKQVAKAKAFANYVLTMQAKKGEIGKKYKKYGETFLTPRDLTPMEQKRVWDKEVCDCPIVFTKKDEHYKDFGVLMEAVRDIRTNLRNVIPVIKGLDITPNTAVSESRESTTESISKMGTSILGCVVRLMVKKEKEYGMKILADLLKRGVSPNELKFHYTLRFNEKIRGLCSLSGNGVWEKDCHIFYDGQYKSYGPEENFFTPQQILNKFKNKKDLSVKQKEIIEKIDSLFALNKCFQ